MIASLIHLIALRDQETKRVLMRGGKRNDDLRDVQTQTIL